MRSNKHRVSYNSGDGIVEVTIRDATYKTEEKLRVNQGDFKGQRKVGTILKNKYGVDFTPDVSSEYVEKEMKFFDF